VLKWPRYYGVIGRHVTQNILKAKERKKERNKQTTLGGTSTHAGTMVKITKFI
jgi:hypothetical protein